MDTTTEKLLNDFEVGWNWFEKSEFLKDSYSIDMLLSVFRRKFMTNVEFVYGYINLAALKIDLSEVKIRVSNKSLVCLIRIRDDTSASAAEVFRNLTTAHYERGVDGYCTIAIVCGYTEEIKKRCRSSNVDIITLDYLQLKGIISSYSWSDTLAQILRKGKEPDILSPYDEIGICPPEMFFGRKRELERLTSHAMGHGYSLVGCRRVGKSSLLLRLKQHYDQIGEPTYYIDCQTCFNTETFYDEIVKRTNRKDYDLRKKISLKDYLIRLSSKDKKPTNLFLDEVDWVIAHDARKNYQYIINELLSAERTEKIPFRLWMAGFKDLYWAVIDRKGPLFGKTRTIELQPLRFEDVRELILKPLNHLGYEFEKEDRIIKRIYADTAGHPSFIQLYCRLLVDVLVQEKVSTIKLEILDSVRKKNDFLDYVLDTFIDNTSALEKMIVLSVLDKKNFNQLDVKNELLKKYNIQLDYQPLYMELRDLRFGGILRQTSGTSSFQYPVMAEVIREIGTPEYIRSEFIDEAKESARKVNEDAKRTGE